MLNDDWSSNLEKYKVKQEQNGELFNGTEFFYTLQGRRVYRDGLYKVNALNTTELAHAQEVKMVNFMICVFSHNRNNENE